MVPALLVRFLDCLDLVEHHAQSEAIQARLEAGEQVDDLSRNYGRRRL
jgi:hypothetical protein